MKFTEYQNESRKTAVYPNMGKNLSYPTLGLCGESGEVAEKVKKLIRDHKGKVTEEFKQELKKELGDVLWYIAAISSELKLDLDNIASLNIQKLNSRRERGKLKGSGDNR